MLISFTEPTSSVTLRLGKFGEMCFSGIRCKLHEVFKPSYSLDTMNV